MKTLRRKYLMDPTDIEVGNILAKTVWKLLCIIMAAYFWSIGILQYNMFVSSGFSRGINTTIYVTFFVSAILRLFRERKFLHIIIIISDSILIAAGLGMFDIEAFLSVFPKYLSEELLLFLIPLLVFVFDWMMRYRWVKVKASEHQITEGQVQIKPEKVFDIAAIIIGILGYAFIIIGFFSTFLVK